MPLSVVQHNGNADNGSTNQVVVSFGSNNASGNLIYVAAMVQSIGGTNFTVSDTNLNSYSLIDTQSQFNYQLQTSYANSIGGGANTVTV